MYTCHDPSIRQGCPLSLLLFISVLNRDIRKERISGMKIKRETYKSWAFAKGLVIILEDSLPNEKLMDLKKLIGLKV